MKGDANEGSGLEKARRRRELRTRWVLWAYGRWEIDVSAGKSVGREEEGDAKSTIGPDGEQP